MCQSGRLDLMPFGNSTRISLPLYFGCEIGTWSHESKQYKEAFDRTRHDDVPCDTHAAGNCEKPAWDVCRRELPAPKSEQSVRNRYPPARWELLPELRRQIIAVERRLEMHHAAIKHLGRLGGEVLVEAL